VVQEEEESNLSGLEAELLRSDKRGLSAPSSGPKYRPVLAEEGYREAGECVVREVGAFPARRSNEINAGMIIIMSCILA